jgi:hypothetical protein
MVINKQLHESARLTLDGLGTAKTAQIWELASGKPIRRRSVVPIHNGAITTAVPAQSVTLFVAGGH